MTRKILRNTALYFLLILGYVYLYIGDAEVLIHPDKEPSPKSKVNFIYQEF